MKQEKRGTIKGTQLLCKMGVKSYPCKKQTSQETAEKSTEFFSIQKKILRKNTRGIKWEFGKAPEDLQWNHCTSTPHRPETNDIAERAFKTVKESTSSFLLQFGLDEKWWAESMGCYCYLRNVQDL